MWLHPRLIRHLGELQGLTALTLGSGRGACNLAPAADEDGARTPQWCETS
jgi:hypothetical protein